MILVESILTILTPLLVACPQLQIDLCEESVKYSKSMCNNVFTPHIMVQVLGVSGSPVTVFVEEADPVLVTSEPSGHGDSTSVKTYLRKGKIHWTEGRWRNRVGNSTESTKTREGGWRGAIWIGNELYYFSPIQVCLPLMGNCEVISFSQSWLVISFPASDFPVFSPLLTNAGEWLSGTLVFRQG